MDGDALDGLDMAQLEALSAQLAGKRGPKVTQAVQGKNKLRRGRFRGIRHGFGRDEVDNINETVDIVISLPLYMVVGMEKNEGNYRQAIRDYLRNQGWDAWADSRFLMAVRGDMMRAKDKFSRNVG